MMELDSGDVLEPVLFSPSSKSHIKYNSIIIMLLDTNNNTSHLCLILLLSILLLVVFYITLFMKTYHAAKLKMISKSSKKVHHHIHRTSANLYKGSASATDASGGNGHKLSASADATNGPLYQRSGNSSNNGSYQKITTVPSPNTSGVYHRMPHATTSPSDGTVYQNQKFSVSTSTSSEPNECYQRSNEGASNMTSGGSYKVVPNKVPTSNSSSVHPKSSSNPSATSGNSFHKINTINESPVPSSETHQKVTSNSAAPSSAAQPQVSAEIDLSLQFNAAQSSWDGENYEGETSCAPQKVHFPSLLKPKPVADSPERKGKMPKRDSGGAVVLRKTTKKKETSDSLYHRKSSHSRDSASSSDSPSPPKPNRKRNPRISEPPPWSGDPPAWLRPASHLTDGANGTSHLDETEGLQTSLRQSEDEDDDEASTTQSTASSGSHTSIESEVFTTSSGVSTGGSTRSSNVSCSSNSSDDGAGCPSRRSSSDDCNKENRPDLTNLPASLSRETFNEIPSKANAAPVNGSSTLTRRQKKNRVRRNLEINARIPINKLSRFYQRLGLKDTELHKYLSAYAMTQQQLINFSFPFESKFYTNKAVIYSPGRYNPKTLDPKAREFVPGFNISANKKLLKNQEVMWRPDVPIDDKDKDAQEEKICARCNKSFFLSNNRSTGQDRNYEYLTQENCHYHWGKVTKSWNNGVQNCIYACCNEEQYKTLGCVYAKLHVWSGLKSGINGPLDGYVKTKPRKTPPPNGWGVYALDTEMVYTVHGLEVARVTVVNVDGRLIYNTLVKPDCEVIDYNTKYSGISARDYVKNPYKSLRDVQNDLMGFISRDSLIVGHGLENDMRALKLIHSNIIDTSILFPHTFGLPYRRSLKSIVSQLLHQSIQSGTHDSFEDARACVDLVLWKLINQLISGQ